MVKSFDNRRHSVSLVYTFVYLTNKNQAIIFLYGDSVLGDPLYARDLFIALKFEKHFDFLVSCGYVPYRDFFSILSIHASEGNKLLWMPFSNPLHDVDRLTFYNR